MAVAEQKTDTHASEAGASYVTTPVQRMRSTIAIQRQITDEEGDEYDFEDDPPDWFIDLSKSDQRRVMTEDELLFGLKKTEKYTKVLKRLGITLETDSEEDEDGEYTEKKAKRTSKPSGLFNQVYKVPTLKRTNSGNGLITLCEEPKCHKRNRILILEDNVANKKGKYHERDYVDKYGESRKPPLCHSKDHPAAWVLSALEEMINDSKGQGYGSTSAYQTSRNYTEAKRTVEWEMPELKPGHTVCNAKHKDKRWGKLSKNKQDKLKKEVFKHLEGRGLVSGSWNNPTWK